VVFVDCLSVEAQHAREVHEHVAHSFTTRLNSIQKGTTRLKSCRNILLPGTICSSKKKDKTFDDFCPASKQASKQAVDLCYLLSCKKSCERNNLCSWSELSPLSRDHTTHHAIIVLQTDTSWEYCSRSVVGVVSKATIHSISLY
jgi:hypothetical protein